MINIALIGSTGSIGVQTLDVAARYPDKFRVVSLAAGANTRAFFNQVEKFKPSVATLAAPIPEDFKLSHGETRFFSGEEAYLNAVTDNADIAVVALVGFIGVKAVLKAIEKGKNVALANKESLVAGGALVMKAAAEKGVKIFPIDSEHSAVWQSLGFDTEKPYKKIILTASGGAFRDKPLSELENLTAEEALKHPNWNMGKKITVDCATMVNKGFEVIEAMWLFGAPLEKIEVVIHRESIIHSMVEYDDNAVIAQLGAPSMEIPIQLAISGERLPVKTPPLDFAAIGNLTFGKVDEKRYPCFYLALECAKKGANYPCALNAANEIAVNAFLDGKIKFTDIYTVIYKTVRATEKREITSLALLEAEDCTARKTALKIIGELNDEFIA